MTNDDSQTTLAAEAHDDDDGPAVGLTEGLTPRGAGAWRLRN